MNEWTWHSTFGTHTLQRDESVYLEDGTNGFVETVDLRGSVPKILVTRRKREEEDLPDIWVEPCQIAG